MKKKIHLTIFALLASFSVFTSAHAGYVELTVGYDTTRTGKSIPIHNGSVLGTVHQTGGPGNLGLTVKKNLVGTKPVVLVVSQRGQGLNTGRAKVDPSNYFPVGKAGLARGKVSISGS